MLQQPPSTPASPPDQPMCGTGQREAVALSIDWLQGRLTFALRANAALALVVLVLVGLNVAQFLTKPEPAYFAVDDRGQVVKLVPVDQPLLSNDALTQWAAETARKAYSLNFVDNESQLGVLRDRFSPGAYSEFIAQMEQSVLPQIKSQRLIVEAISEPAVIQRSGLNTNGHFLWQVEVPVSVTSHFGAGQSRTQRYRVSLTIQRVDNRFRPESGVVVTQFIARLA
jgi:intracellular multiplication protein IcmL